MAEKRRVLILCTGNSCRSQMAEAWARYLKNDILEPYSAGVNPGIVDAKAIKVMAEASIDISNGQSKHVDSLSDIEFDYVITVCDSATAEVCISYAVFCLKKDRCSKLCACS